MTSFTEELDLLKSDFLYLKKKISSIELRIKEMESKVPFTKSDSRAPVSSSLSSYHAQVKDYHQFENATLHFPPPPTPQNLDKKTRNIIEELMWESTLSKAVIQVRETFEDDHSREMFLRCSFEMVLEKDEQYRKMIGTLFGHLLNQNVINQSSLLNSLCSVLMVIENSNNYNTNMWQNLTEILLPIVMDSHIKMLQLQRKAQAILKQEYYQEFINHLARGLEASKKQRNFKDSCYSRNSYLQSSVSGIPPPVTGEVLFPNDTGQKKLKLDMAGTNCIDRNGKQNVCDFESISKYKHSLKEVETENCKAEVESLLNDLVYNENLENAVQKIRELQIIYDIKTIIEEVINVGVQKEPSTAGALLVKMISCNLSNVKEVLTTYCKNVDSVEKLILNPKTRTNICCTFAEILSPLITSKKTNLNQLATVASTILAEETQTIFIWLVEKILNDRGITTLFSVPQPSNTITDKLLKRFQKFIDKGEQSQRNNDVDESNLPNTQRSPLVRSEKPLNERPGPRDGQERNQVPEPSHHETYSLLKQKKMHKERMENIGDKYDIKIENLLDQTVKKEDGEAGDTQAKLDVTKTESEQPPPKQPENLPSSAIKEKMEEIIENLMETDDLDGCVATIRSTFNECQTDLVFKAAFEYTKNKPSEYKIQSGLLIAEAFKHDPKRIGAQIMNILSLELGDFIDSPELWKGIAEIICPSILSSLIRFSDLKLLPKYFKDTPYCASLLSALFKEIIRQKGPEWLEDNWKKSKLDLTTFLSDDLVYKFINDNDFSFIFKNNDTTPLKENTYDI